MSLRILIADDEPLARARLRSLVEELGHQVCAEVGDGASAEEELRRTQPDMLLLDINMPEIDGLALAQRLEKGYPHTPVVFVTAHAEHALAAFDVAVRDYMLKPVRRERLKKTLDRIAEGATGITPVIPPVRVTIGRKELLVCLDQVDCFVAEDGYVMARSAALEGFVDARLYELEDRFGDLLLRVHRSCLAVKSAVVGMEAHSANDHRLLFLDGLAPAPISRREIDSVRAFLRKPLQGGRTRPSDS
jgi:two-component system, LytTR family, response regulator AlgR